MELLWPRAFARRAAQRDGNAMARAPIHRLERDAARLFAARAAGRGGAADL